MDGHGDQRTWALITALVASLGFLSAVFGFAAESTKLQLVEVQDVMRRGCRYPNHPKSPTKGFGVAALATLFVIRLLAFFPASRNVSMIIRVSFIFSWVTWFVAMSFYVVGLVMIDNQQEEIRSRDFQSYYVCKVVKPRIFGAGASFALASNVLLVICRIVIYHHAEKNKHTLPTQHSIVAMS